MEIRKSTLFPICENCPIAKLAILRMSKPGIEYTLVVNCIKVGKNITMNSARFPKLRKLEDDLSGIDLVAEKGETVDVTKSCPGKNN